MKNICFGCTICLNYMHDLYNCQGQTDKVCHEFDDRFATKEDKLVMYIYEFAQLYGQYYHNNNFDTIMEKVSEKIEIPEEFLKRLELL